VGGEGEGVRWAKPGLVESLESQGHDPEEPCLWSKARKLVLGYCLAERLEVRGLPVVQSQEAGAGVLPGRAAAGKRPLLFISRGTI